MDTQTIVILPGADPVNLVTAASLEVDEIYYVENTGLSRVGLVERTAMPVPANTQSHQVIPRGLMSIRTIQPDGERGIWCWDTEGLGSDVTISKVPA